MKTAVHTIKDLVVYNLAYQTALEVFELSKKFPKEEIFSLTDQVRRSSRSIALNIREGFAKRRYKSVFIRHLTDSLGSSEETRGWFEFAYDHHYIEENEFLVLDKRYDEINAMLFSLIQKWDDFSL